jgi:protein tyrosine/serine phosphatase
MHNKSLLLAAVAGIFISSQMASPASASLSKTKAALPHFRVVDAAVMRGGQPSESGLKELKDKGIKTIINLRHNDTTVKDEAIEAEKLGLNYVSIPLDGIHKPSAAAIDQFLKVAQDPKAQPVYVHCEHGEDRTGVMVAIYREEAYKWNADAAYQEALFNGFHPAYYWLTDAVFQYEERKGERHSTNRPLVVKMRDSFDQALHIWKPKKAIGKTATPIVATQAGSTPKT